MVYCFYKSNTSRSSWKAQLCCFEFHRFFFLINILTNRLAWNCHCSSMTTSTTSTCRRPSLNGRDRLGFQCDRQRQLEAEAAAAQERKAPAGKGHRPRPKSLDEEYQKLLAYLWRIERKAAQQVPFALLFLFLFHVPILSFYRVPRNLIEFPYGHPISYHFTDCLCFHCITHLRLL